MLISCGGVVVMEERVNSPSPPEPDGEHSDFQPRGIVLFVFLMLLGYGLYWAYLWFITVIERGVSG
jgi:hypothetical protein